MRSNRTAIAGVVVAGIALLMGCHGQYAPGVPIAPAIVTPAARAQTQAWGRLVDDPSGKPLRGVLVRLEPWRPCHELKKRGDRVLDCPRPVATTTTKPDGKFELHARSGHYLLVIGSDDPSDMTRPTIHDNVHLDGDRQHLTGPTPCPTFAPAMMYDHCLPQLELVTPNPTERSGDYRLTTIDPKYEVTCITGFDYYREQRGLADVVIDEWLTENNRNQLLMVSRPRFRTVDGVWNGWPNLATGFSASSGGTDRKVDRHPGCWIYNVRAAFYPHDSNSLPYSGDGRMHWYGGRYGPWNYRGLPGNLLGESQYPRDPRNEPDPNIREWP